MLNCFVFLLCPLNTGAATRRRSTVGWSPCTMGRAGAVPGPAGACLLLLLLPLLPFYCKAEAGQCPYVRAPIEPTRTESMQIWRVQAGVLVPYEVGALTYGVQWGDASLTFRSSDTHSRWPETATIADVFAFNTTGINGQPDVDDSQWLSTACSALPAQPGNTWDYSGWYGTNMYANLAAYDLLQVMDDQCNTPKSFALAVRVKVPSRVGPG